MKKVMYLMFIALAGNMKAGALEDLKKCSGTSMNHKSMSFTMRVNSYLESEDARPIQTYTTSSVQNGKEFIVHMPGKIILNNYHCSLIVDEQHKNIVYGKPLDAAKATQENGLGMLSIDSIYNNNYQISYKENTEKKKVISIKPKTDSPLLETIIEIDAVTWMYSKITYLFKKPDGNDKTFEKMVIEYKDVKIDGAIGKEHFNEKKFVESKKGELVGTEAYKTFRVQNNTKPMSVSNRK